MNKIEGLENSKEEIKNYFIKELEKARKGEESIFTCLLYFRFEGKNLKQGEEELKEYFQTLKEKGDFEKIKEITKGFSGAGEFIWFYSNQKKLEYYLELPKLRTIELRRLDYLGENKPKELQNIKKELNLLSLKDWVKLGNLAEFLDFDKERIESIKSGFEKVHFEEILENPEEFDTWKTARHINHLKQQGREIDRQKLEKEFRASKINSAIKEYILNSPKENLNGYLENLGWKGEINEDIVFAARLHKVLTNEGKTKNKEVLEKLLKGKNSLDFEENKLWLEEMENKIDTEKWLSHKEKEYTPLTEKDSFASLEKSRTEQLREIVKHFKEIGIEIKPEIQEIEKIFSEKQREIPPEAKKDIKTHIQAYQSLSEIEKSALPKKIVLETEENPLKIIQMGEKVVGSCLAIRGGHEEGAVCNAADINKKIIWAKDEKGEILGRVLVGITDEGKLAHFRVFNNDPRSDLKSLYKDFISEFAGELKSELTSRGNIKELVGENWYDDGIVEL